MKHTHLPKPPPHRLSGLFIAMLVLWIPGQAMGFELFGAGTRGQAMGGAQGAASKDAFATWYNPALLTASTHTSLQGGLRLLFPQLSIDRAADSPLDAQGGRDSLLPDPNVHMTLGARTSLGGIWQNRLALGFVFSSPLLNPTRLEVVDPASPHFALYQTLPDRFTLGGGLGVDFGGGLHLGASILTLMTLEGEADVSLDTTRRRIVRRDLRASLNSHSAPVLGLAWKPDAPWSLGLTWRGRLEVPYKVPILFRFSEVGDIFFEIKGVALYTPAQLNLGTAWEGDAWTLAMDLTWARWSQAPSPAAQVVAGLDLLGDPAPDQDPGPLLELHSVEFRPGFKDTLQIHMGAEFVKEAWSFRGGYSFRPTPVPDQVGYSNLIDNHAHFVSLGLGCALSPEWSVHGVAQGVWLQTRTVDKDPSRDTLSVGDYTASGWLWNLGAEVEFFF